MFYIFDIFIASQRSGRYLKTFLAPVGSVLTEYQPVPIHFDPVHAQKYGFMPKSMVLGQVHSLQGHFFSPQNGPLLKSKVLGHYVALQGHFFHP